MLPRFLRYRDPTRLMLLASAIAATTVACTGEPAAVNPTTPPSPSPSATVTASPTAITTAQPDRYGDAIAAAVGANNLSRTAVGRSDWAQVETYWAQAVNLLGTVPVNSPNYDQAQVKRAEYQQNLAAARARSQPAPPINACPEDTNPDYFFAPIARMAGTLPVVEVTFNNLQRFELVLDTGASQTVITAAMADSLGLVPMGAQLVGVGDGGVDLVALTLVDTQAIDGRVMRNLPVAVVPGGEGLLGQDFLAGYDVTIKERVVEFRRRAGAMPERQSVFDGAELCEKDIAPASFTVPIKGRQAGIPIVAVSFNGQKTYDMLFDTGASMTVVTRQMASELGLPYVGESGFGLAGGRVAVLPIAYAGEQKLGERVRRNTLVAVSNLERGLLGQDLLAGYDVSIGDQSITFRRRN